MMYEKRQVVLFKNRKKTKKIDAVVVETGLKIFLNGKKLFTLLCSPENLDYLAKGIAFSSGIVKRKEEIKSLLIKDSCCYLETTVPVKLCERMISSGCGGTVNFFRKIEKNKNTNFKISAREIFCLMDEFQKLAKVYRLTGGVHCAGISDGERIMSFHEDIGRHNALDKVIGECFSKDISVSNKIILSSGRISSEITLKAATVGIPVIVSRSAPTTYAIRLARLFDITLVGFVRGKRMNIYTSSRRIF
ncbi:MAG: formate dehydrogenase accessory sulfurtransferase FdhD [Candidatus Omnitrophica bacterium]|nr:formate dehydrogenase accessory sulfurtransferase FdhD [Candidatus Omnitrophota bacterium]